MRKATIKAIAIAIAILLVPAIASATSVTGTVTDPNGLAYSGGTLVITLTSPGGASPYITATGAPVSNPGSTITLDINGKFSVTLQDNTTITPASTQWQFTVTCGSGCVNPGLGKGPQQFTVTVTISGGSQDISATLQAAAPALSNSSGSGLPSGCIPSGNSLGTCQPTSDVSPLILKDKASGVADILDLLGGGGTQLFSFANSGALSLGGSGGGQATFNGATSGSATISVTATGGTLNLGSTNATVTSAGGLTVASCAGCSSLSTTSMFLNDHFCSGTAGNGALGQLGWTTGGSGNVISGPGNFGTTYPNICAWRQDSSTTASSASVISMVNVSFGALGSNAGWNSLFESKIEQTTNTRRYVGYSTANGSTPGAAPADFIGFRYDTNACCSDATFKFVVCKASTCTSSISFGGTDTNFDNVRIYSPIAGEVHAVFNGGTDFCYNSGGTGGCTLSANVPTAELTPNFVCGNDTTAASSKCQVDLFQFIK